MQRRRVLGLMAACGLAACSMPSLEADPQRAAEAHALYGDLVEGRDDALLARMSSGNDPATVRAQLPMIRTFAPAGPAPEPKPLGWNANASTNGQRYSVAQEYEYPDRIVRADTTFLKEGEAWKVESFNVNARMKPGLAAPAAEPAPPA
ncbi:hypothetical protein [Brevundimonas sp.]|uniref:hypothetical protein n=1 Tax=Brevundimonas sp. TaxID=1871086 RepID=UPI002737A8E7|nr:hypothetical protein [Brevundimonas sp.]MDP3800846.1 hypothetical protein [Brevundimonas sp.]